MKAFLALVRKQLGESRWPLGISAAALFGLSWLFVFFTSLAEAEWRKAIQSGDLFPKVRIMGMMRAMGISDTNPSTILIEMTFWSHPFILLTVSIWAIARGSAAVAGELEKGTLDLVLSRPISRASYLGSHVLVAAFGLALLAAALVAGNLVGSRYNLLVAPAHLTELFKPATNLAALGLAIFGYSVLFSAVDIVRWRPNLIASMLTLGGFIAWVVALTPVMATSRWKPWLGRVSIFKAYNPAEAVTTAAHWSFNTGLLTGLGVAGIILGYLAFSVRSLPSNS